MMGFVVLAVVLALEMAGIVWACGWEQPAPAIFQVVGTITALIGSLNIAVRCL